MNDTITAIEMPYPATPRFRMASRDWTEFGANADNTDRAWVVGVRSTIFGGRGVCRTSFPMPQPTGADVFAQRAEADRIVLTAAAVTVALMGIG